MAARRGKRGGGDDVDALARWRGDAASLDPAAVDGREAEGRDVGFWWRR